MNKLIEAFLHFFNTLISYVPAAWKSNRWFWLFWCAILMIAFFVSFFMFPLT